METEEPLLQVELVIPVGEISILVHRPIIAGYPPVILFLLIPALWVLG